MITIEEYIKKRKEDEKINEFDLENKSENMQIFIGYVIEYYNTYIDIDEMKKKLLKEDIKLRGYNKLITDYSIDIQEWLLRYYSLTGHRLHRPVQNYLKTFDIFLLVNNDNHFNRVSHKAYAKLGKKYKGLDNNLEWLQELIREEHAIQSKHYSFEITDYSFRVLDPSENLIKYVEKTLKNHNVNLLEWSEKYVFNFSDQFNKWPVGHKVQTEYEGYYEYDYKQKKNLFNIDVIYGQVSQLPYIKGKKKMLSSLVKIMWANHIDDIDSKTLKVWKEEINNL